jgi:hypothetical protein
MTLVGGKILHAWGEQRDQDRLPDLARDGSAAAARLGLAHNVAAAEARHAGEGHALRQRQDRHGPLRGIVERSRHVVTSSFLEQLSATCLFRNGFIGSAPRASDPEETAGRSWKR